MPKPIPIAEHTTNPIIAQSTGIWAGTCKSIATRLPPASPNNTPAIPPNSLKNTASDKN